MVLGFGFNKTKVLAAAEKYIQQGKLQNAIVEYEKVTKSDPKDLAVINTIGDLYSRLGQVDKAITCFRTVGESYASQGFTLKAIAMYKKLTKLNPSALECNLKLAELYTQQGLFNDARSQYMQVAESHVQNRNLNDAAMIFQKILELDPQNAVMQTKLADLYMGLGKKEEARNIFFNAAETLRERKAYGAADEALSKVLTIDPQNSRAIEMRATIALEAGDSRTAITMLEQLPDLDSRADSLRLLMRSYGEADRLADSEPVARKLFTVHGDQSGLRTYGDYLIAGSKVQQALKFYQEFEDRLLATDTTGFLQGIYSCLNRIKGDAAALEAVRNLFFKAGDTTHIPEVTELLAHACVQDDNLEKARTLYKELMGLEPENPVHVQNYKQIVAKLGDDPGVRQLSEAEGGQAFLVDELEPVTAAVTQEYPPDIAEAVQSALTDSELFDSYNVPAKAVAPLETALLWAPKDVRLNQRLASLYSRCDRYTDAAARCRVLEEVYSVAGLDEEAAQYSEMAARYEERAALLPPELQRAPAEHYTAAPVVPLPTEKKSALNKFFSTMPEVVESAAPATPDATPALMEPSAHEFDLSDEWDKVVAGFTPEAPVAAAPVFDTTAANAEQDEVGDLLEEIRFYISQAMWTEAAAGVEKLSGLAPKHEALADLRSQVAAHTEDANAAAEVEAADEKDFVIETASARPAVFEVEPIESDASFGDDLLATSSAPVTDVVLTGFELPTPAAEVAAPEAVSAVAHEDVVLGPPTVAPMEMVASASAAAAPKPAAGPASIGDFALDLENSLGDDFALAAPAPKASAVPVAPVVAAPPAPAPIIQPTPQSTPVAPIAASTAAEVSVPVIEPEEANSMLADIFAEFKDDVEESAPAQEDPEMHYNLGMAFREMGLLDEAIGELQKVAQAIDRGAEFRHTLQCYTWLAQSFVDKGIPEASFKWYDKALKLATDEEMRTAIHYEIGCAFEQAGNKQQSLQHFTEVYTSNIDYRDVSERIKALKS